MSFIDWLFGERASDDVIDRDFIMTDMVDIELTEDDLVEAAYWDASADLTDQSGSALGGSTQHGKSVY